MASNNKKLIEKLRRSYGNAPNHGALGVNLENIKKFFDYRRGEKPDDFFIDGITWADLDMNSVFLRMDSCCCSSGEQYLYYTLRSPSADIEKWEERRRLIEFVENRPEERLNIQIILSRLGKSTLADITEVFKSSERGNTALFAYLALSIGLLISAIVSILSYSIFGSTQFLPFMGILFILNPLIHEFRSKAARKDTATVNYCVDMIFAANRIKKMNISPLSEILSPMYSALEKAKSILKLGGVEFFSGSANSMAELLCAWLMIDLIMYEYLKNKLVKIHSDIFTVHERLGMLDCAIAIASYRKSAGRYVTPEIDFSNKSPSLISGLSICHPLIKNPVPNSISLSGPILITGSNASGKSTFLKTLAINAILAQSICTALGAEFRMSSMRVFSSMAISDNLLSGESYYIAEIKSLKRIFDYANRGERIFCVIDEVLRGTNTVERISASSQLLKNLAVRGLLCAAATHDLELCSLLSEVYELYHFQENINNGEMLFDYKLYEGKSTSRNAIKLLELMGFESLVVSGAQDMARRYDETGSWSG